MAVTPAAILARLRALVGREAALDCVVAWSGGLDSTVLLHLLRQARRLPHSRLTVRALHVDHGLQPAAAEFRRFCLRTARKWKLPLVVVQARVAPGRGASVEEAAREARRKAFAAMLAPAELLVTAQHADDQLETVLLALLRGAGPAGLAGMPGLMRLGAGQLARPLLDFTHADLAAYAEAQQLPWIDDPTNDDTRFDRNFLRSVVLPQLRSRWPAVARTVGRSARHCAVAAEVVAAGAGRDLSLAADGADLDIAVLRRWNAPRRAAVLRAWLLAGGARAPNERHMQEIEAMLAARVDAHPELNLPDATVRRKGGRLCLDARSGNLRR